MVKLREIPPEKLKEIRRFVIQKRGKIPVTGGGPTPTGEYVKNMIEIIREKWGVELSPAQIFSMQRRPKKVSLPGEVVDWLEEEFGDAREGLKRMVKVMEQMAGKPPLQLKKAISSLGGRTLSYEEAVIELKTLGYENPDEILRELGRLGYLTNERGMLRFYRYRRPPEFSIIKFFE
jgi:hypothetical protein